MECNPIYLPSKDPRLHLKTGDKRLLEHAHWYLRFGQNFKFMVHVKLGTWGDTRPKRVDLFPSKRSLWVWAFFKIIALKNHLVFGNPLKQPGPARPSLWRNWRDVCTSLVLPRTRIRGEGRKLCYYFDDRGDVCCGHPCATRSWPYLSVGRAVHSMWSDSHSSHRCSRCHRPCHARPRFAALFPLLLANFIL